MSGEPLGILVSTALGEERLDPGDKVAGDTTSSEDAGQLIGVDIVKPTFDVKEKSRYVEGGRLEKADFVCQDGSSVETAEAS